MAVKKTSNLETQTKKAIIKELRRLIKPRTYTICLWRDEGVKVTATWESDVSISIDADYCTTQGKKVVIIEEMQADLVQFKADIDKVCSIAKALAKEAEESEARYFEELLAAAEA